MVLVCLLVFCSPEEVEEPPKAETKAELLSSAVWMVASVEIQPAVEIDGKQTTDYYSIFIPCLKDDLTKYNRDGTGYYDVGDAKCEPDEPQQESFTWWFENDKTRLVQGDGFEFVLEHLDENKLTLSEKLSGSEVVGGDANKIYTITAIHLHPK